MKIQNLVLPPLGGMYPKEMFWRGDGLYDGNSLCLNKGERASFDTFYNAIQPGIWVDECGVYNLALHISGSGKVKICFYQKVENNEVTFLGEELIDLSDGGESISVPNWGNGKHAGIIYFIITALERVLITYGYFWTNQEPRQIVKLGLVITHYNRQNQVIPAAKRIVKELLDDLDYSGIDLVIVDNSQNLSRKDFDDRVIIIKNKNMGGSGGFARGLLYLKDNGFTHCNFMDDDAGCLTESIKRTYSFFSFYFGKLNVGISGVLLRDDTPHIVHESCGKWHKIDVRPINSGKNLLNTESLLALGKTYSHKGYGAWCYFGFKIADIKKWPFPFFVRGDDILFSLQNNLKIINVLGIAATVDSFGDKDSANTFYLTLRAHFVISIFMNQANVWSWWNRFVSYNKSPLFSGCYSWSYGAYLALVDVLSSKYYFGKDIEGNVFSEHIKKIVPLEESVNPCEYIKLMKKNKYDREGVKHYILRKLTFNGLLCPVNLLDDNIIWNKADGACYRRLCCYRKIFFIKKSGEIIVAKHDKIEILKGYYRNIIALVLILKNINSTIQRVKKELEECTEEEFWRKALL